MFLDYFTNSTANTGGTGATWEILYQKFGNNVLSPNNPQDSLTLNTSTSLTVATASHLRHYSDNTTLPFTIQGLPSPGDYIFIGVRRTFSGGVGVEYSSPLLLSVISISY